MLVTRPVVVRISLAAAMVTSVLKQMAAHFGFVDAFFSTHSLRIGGLSCGTKADMNIPRYAELEAGVVTVRLGTRQWDLICA